MGKITVGTVGTIKIKMDVKDDVYFDAKPPHVSFVRDGEVIIPHVFLNNIDDVVGFDADTKKAIYWVREHKYELEEQYRELNKM